MQYLYFLWKKFMNQKLLLTSSLNIVYIFPAWSTDKTLKEKLYTVGAKYCSFCTSSWKKFVPRWAFVFPSMCIPKALGSFVQKPQCRHEGNAKLNTFYKLIFKLLCSFEIYVSIFMLKWNKCCIFFFWDFQHHLH